MLCGSAQADELAILTRLPWSEVPCARPEYMIRGWVVSAYPPDLNPEGAVFAARRAAQHAELAVISMRYLGDDIDRDLYLDIYDPALAPAGPKQVWKFIVAGLDQMCGTSGDDYGYWLTSMADEYRADLARMSAE